MLVYASQCYFLSCFPPHVPPLCLQICSLYLILYSCSVNRFNKRKSGTYIQSNNIIVDQLLSHVQLFAIPWTTAQQASLSSTISQSLLRTMWTESVVLSNHLMLSPSPFAITLYPWVTSLDQVAKGLEFQIQHQSFQWIPSFDSL